MSQNIKSLLIVLFVIACFILANVLAGWRMKKAAEFIVQDLQEKKAFDPASSVVLPYSRRSMFRIGLRDYRPGALKQLVKRDIVRSAEGDRYYLRESHTEILAS
jgi:hypothetical protein